MKCRKSGIITGLPDAYGRGRIIGDYRRVALYGVDRLLEAKRAERAQIDDMWPTDEIIRTREELADQMRALNDLAAMAKRYDCDITQPPTMRRKPCSGPISPTWERSRRRTARRCRSAAFPASSTSTSSATSKKAALDEAGAQELWDQLVQKLRIVRFLRTPEYDALFSGDPYWATECVGGVDLNGRAAGDQKQLSDAAHTDQPRSGAGAEHHGAVVQKPAGQLQALLHQGQQGNVLAAIRKRRPDATPLGRRLCHRLLRLGHGLGKQMQFFGARVNLAKALLYAINGGRDEISGEQIAPPTQPVTSEVLDYDEVFNKFDPSWSGSRAPTCTR